MDHTLLIFLKAPVPGRVKTRLAQDIGDEAAAAAYVEMARAVRDETELLHDARIQFVYAPGGDFPDLGWLDMPDAVFWKQEEGDLGTRLGAAFKRAFDEYGATVCAVGTDSPGLPSKRIREAFLRLDDRDVVLGPTEDGGYYLIGMSAFHPTLFNDIPWSSKETFRETLKRAQKEGLKIDELAGYFDIDSLADYERWKMGPSSATGQGV